MLDHATAAAVHFRRGMAGRKDQAAAQEY